MRQRNINTYNNLSAAIRWIWRNLEGILMSLLVVLLVLAVVMGILARYIQFQVVFATELGKYLFIWLSCVGISSAIRDDQHIRLMFLADRLPVSKSVIRIISQLFFLFMTLFLLYFGLKLTIMHFTMGKSAMGFNFPMFIFSLAVPAGFALCSIRLVQDLIQLFRGFDQEKEPETQPPNT